MCQIVGQNNGRLRMIIFISRLFSINYHIFIALYKIEHQISHFAKKIL